MSPPFSPFIFSHRHQQDHICSQIKKELDSTATAPQRVSQILGQLLLYMLVICFFLQFLFVQQ